VTGWQLWVETNRLNGEVPRYDQYTGRSSTCHIQLAALVEPFVFAATLVSRWTTGKYRR
jgi:hypothetical protein